MGQKIIIKFRKNREAKKPGEADEKLDGSQGDVDRRDGGAFSVSI